MWGCVVPRMNGKSPREVERERKRERDVRVEGVLVLGMRHAVHEQTALGSEHIFEREE